MVSGHMVCVIRASALISLSTPTANDTLSQLHIPYLSLHKVKVMTVRFGNNRLGFYGERLLLISILHCVNPIPYPIT